jgi:hypothetical protein
MIENDQRLARARDQRLRIGVYTFNATVPGVRAPAPARPARMRRSKDPT